MPETTFDDTLIGSSNGLVLSGKKPLLHQCWLTIIQTDFNLQNMYKDV